MCDGDEKHTYCEECAYYYEAEEDEEAEDDVEEAGDDVEKPLVGADHLGEIEMADRHSNDEEEHWFMHGPRFFYFLEILNFVNFVIYEKVIFLIFWKSDIFHFFNFFQNWTFYLMFINIYLR